MRRWFAAAALVLLAACAARQDDPEEIAAGVFEDLQTDDYAKLMLRGENQYPRPKWFVTSEKMCDMVPNEAPRAHKRVKSVTEGRAPKDTLRIVDEYTFGAEVVTIDTIFRRPKKRSHGWVLSKLVIKPSKAKAAGMWFPPPEDPSWMRKPENT